MFYLLVGRSTNSISCLLHCQLHLFSENAAYDLMKKITISLVLIVLLISVSLNIYFYQEYKKYQDRWLNQFITTSEIESLLKHSGIDTSFNNIYQIAESLYGDSVKEVTVSEPVTNWGADVRAIGVNDSLLLFKDGLYWGSRSGLR